MYTQCPKCETVFKMSADVLRTAGGQVRCGQCGEVFNALARLAEDASAFATVESPLEMEARANRILESPPASTPPAHPNAPDEEGEEDLELLDAADVEFAQLQVIDVPSETLEFSLPPAELDRVFVEPKLKGKEGETARPGAPGGGGAAPAPPFPAERAPGAVPAHGRAPASGRTPARTPAAPPTPATRAAPSAPPPSAPPPSTPASTAPAPAARSSTGAPRPGPAMTAAPTGPAQRSPGPSAPPRAPLSDLEPPTAPAEPPIEEADIDLNADDALPPHPESRAAQRSRAAEQSADAKGGFVSDEVRRDMLAGMDGVAIPVLEPERERSPTFLLWLGAAIALGALLAMQVFLANRGWFGKTFGVGGAAPPSLSAYQQQVWGVTGEPGASGTLRVRASIMNTSAQLQPYPLLRITLTDRFGNRIGSRDFAPSEYLGRPTVRMLAPGERADATLDIQDPGKEAEGYELDVCLRAGERVACAADAAPQSAR
jgi:predicted Zn finger-like uncharacterized protein